MRAGENNMIKLSTLIRIIIVALAMGLLAQLSAGGASWAATGQDAMRETLPTFTFTPEPVTPTDTPPPPPPATNTPVAPTPDTPATATPTPTPAQAVQVTLSADTDMYDGPGLDYAIIGSLAEGDLVVIVGRNADSTWWQVLYQGDTGWVFGEALTLIPAAYEVPVLSVGPPGATVETPSTLPEAGSGPLLLGGGVLLLASGALSLLVGSRVRRRGN